MDTNRVFEKVASENSLPPKKQWSAPVFEVLGKDVVKAGSAHSTFEGHTSMGAPGTVYYS